MNKLKAQETQETLVTGFRPHLTATPAKAAKIARTLDFIHASYQQPLALQDLAKAAGVSKWDLCRLFAAELDTTPMRVLWKYRLYQGRKGVSNRFYPIYVIARKVGFRSHAHFSRAFLKEFGITPTAYRAERGEEGY